MMPRVLRGLYQRAFVERLQAITRRLDTAIGEIMSARSELADLRAQLAGVEAKQDALDQHVQTVIAGGWDATALSRRLAELEDRQSVVPVRFPPGHYYSPMPDANELLAEPRRSQIWGPRTAVGVDWNAEGQREVLRALAEQERLAFATAQPDDPREYFADNDQFPILDAWLLEGLLRHFRPRRMIEVGSGFSTLVAARVNRESLGGQIDFVAIEPYPRQFLIDGVEGLSSLRVEQVQDTPLDVFAQLSDNDVLFIDTSHTVKTGGDVTWLHNEVVPRLAPGVLVHVHDIFLPGDYPEQWVGEGWGWNEQYLVQAFLAFNSAFEVLIGASWAVAHEPALLAQACPAWDGRSGGGSLWLRRRA
jgi:predicted O-methyltransferase YrrM/BMFP domain-containing protein YqiC